MRNTLLQLLAQLRQHFFPKKEQAILPIEAPHDFHPQPFPLGWRLLLIKLLFIGLVLMALYALFEPQIDRLGS